MTDPLLARLAYRPTTTKLDPIPWPDGLAPTPVRLNAGPDDALPHADIIISAFTAAEGQALADTLSPGYPLKKWQTYTHKWSAYVDQLTDRSPARDEKCLGYYSLVTIGAVRALLFKHNLHPATDSASLPLRQLWRQVVGEVGPTMVITHGTAGGCDGLELGDVAVATEFTWNCQRQFASEPWAHQSYSAPSFTAEPHLTDIAPDLMAVNAGRLTPIATRSPQVVLGRSVESVDFFGFYDTPSDSYGILKADPTAATEEMDDCALAMAMGDLGRFAPAYLSVRNASDPPVPDSIGDLAEQSRWAESIYRRYGYYTTVASSIVCWAIACDL